MTTMYTGALKPFVFNANDLSFILDQIKFRPLFDANGNAVISWDGAAPTVETTPGTFVMGIYNRDGQLLWDGVANSDASGIAFWDGTTDTNGDTVVDAADRDAAALSYFGQSYPSVTSSTGLRDVTGLYNNLIPGNVDYGVVDQPFLRNVASQYGLDSHGHAYFDGSPAYQTGVDQNGDALYGTAYWGSFAFGTAFGGANGFTLPTGTTTDYAIVDANNDGAIQSGEFGNIVDYTPRMISLLTTTGGVTFETDGTGHIIDTNGAATVTDWGMLQSLGIQDAQARFAGTAGEGEYFVGAQNPGVSPANGWFTLFGQFFDHGLDFIDKGGQGKTIKITFAQGDPLYGVIGSNGQPATAITISRATVDGFDADGNPQYLNHTSPFIDQSQTYGSNIAVTELLREWVIDPVDGVWKAGMNLLNGETLATQWQRADGTLTNETLPTLNELRVHVVESGRADLTWDDITNYNGSDQALILDMNPRFDTVHLMKGDPAQDDAVTQAIAVLNADAEAVYGPGVSLALVNDVLTLTGLPGAGPDPLTGASALYAWVNFANFSVMETHPGTTVGLSSTVGSAVGTILLASVGDHYIAGDGRVNENFGLTTVHHVFHEEHNFQINNLISTISREADARAGAMGDNVYDQEYMKQFQVWDAAGVAWNDATGNFEKGGEIAWNLDVMFNAAKLTVEMEYQHVAIDQYARTVTPDIKEFVGYTAGVDPTVSLEYAQSIFRFGHSQLRETLDTIDPAHGLTGKITGYALKLAFLNPDEFAAVGPAAIALGMTHQQGNEIDEFITPALNQGLLGLPLDLAAINIARGRDVGIPALNEFRVAVGLRAYEGWADFGANMIHPDNLVNFIAAYSFDGDVTQAGAIVSLYNSDYADNAAGIDLAVSLGLVQGDMTNEEFETYANDYAYNFMNGGDKGVDAIDTWLGGLAEVHVTGGLLGETFNLVFVDQMERIQDGDRFYYLYRLVNQQFADEIGGGQFKDIIERNTGLTHLGGSAFSYNDQYYDLGATKEVLGVGQTELNTVNNEHKYGAEVNAVGNTKGVFSDGGSSETRNGTTITVRVTDPFTNVTTTRQYIRDTRAVDANAPNGGAGIDGTPNSGAESTEVIVGTKYDDLIHARGGDDTVYGDAGNDIIYGENGIDRLYGGDGKDYIYGGDGAELADGGAGDDFIFGDSSATAAAGTDQLIGGMGNDYISGGIGIDKLAGGGGDDVILGEGETDPFTHGGDGNDYIDGGISGDNLYGDNGDDVIIGGADQDILYGGNGDDLLRPGNPSQALGGGPDEVLGGDGVTDTGFDIIDFSDNNPTTNGVAFDLENQANPQVQIDGTTLVPAATQIEGLVGSSSNDRLTGDANANWLIGGSGNDKFVAGAGDDVIVGGSIRLDAMIGKYQTAYDHNNGNDSATATGITDVGLTHTSTNLTQEQMDTLYQGASHRVAWDDQLDSTGLLAAANAQLGGVDFESHFTEMLRTERFKDLVLGDANGVAAGGASDTLILTGSPNDYVIEQVTYTGHNVLRLTSAAGGSDLVADIDKFQFGTGANAMTFTFDQMVTKPQIASISDSAVTEADPATAAVNASFVVTLDRIYAQDVTIHYKTTDGTATAASDFTAVVDAVLVIPAGSLTGTVNVPIAADLSFEATEAFTLDIVSATVSANDLLNPAATSAITVLDASGSATITDNDPKPSMAVSNVTLAEGNAGTVVATLTVTLDQPVGVALTINYATANGTAIAGSDYTAASGSVTFAPGVTSMPITVTVSSDTMFELDEAFAVNLTSADTLNAAASAQVTIGNDDAAPTISIGNASTAEGNSGTTNANFAISLSAVSGLDTTVNFATSNGTATVASDYNAKAGTATILAGQLTANVAVEVIGDLAFEADENFNVTLSAPTNATLGAAVGIGTIINDDAPGVAASNIIWNGVTPGDGTQGLGNLANGLPAAGAIIGSLSSADPNSPTGHIYALAAGSSAGFTVSASGTVTRTGSAMASNTVYTLNISSTDITGQARTEAFTIQTGTNSVILGTNGANTINGTANDNVLYGSGGADILNGAAGDDTLYGQAGNDVLTGGAGNDVLIGGGNAGGNDVANFAANLINFSFDSVGTDILVTDNVGTLGTDRISGVETLRFNGSDYAVVSGTAAGNANLNGAAGATGAQAVFGFGGDDTLNGGAGNDILHGGEGDDTITQDAATGGRDIVNGGAGTDTYVLQGAAVAETFNIYSKDAWLALGAGHTAAATTGIVVTRNGTTDASVVAELSNIEEIRVNGNAQAGSLTNGFAGLGATSGDTVNVIGNFVGTGLAYNTITVNGAGNTVDISALTSDHRVVLNANGGTGSIVGAARPQDEINGLVAPAPSGASNGTQAMPSFLSHDWQGLGVNFGSWSFHGSNDWLGLAANRAVSAMGTMSSNKSIGLYDDLAPLAGSTLLHGAAAQTDSVSVQSSSEMWTAGDKYHAPVNWLSVDDIFSHYMHGVNGHFMTFI